MTREDAFKNAEAVVYPTMETYFSTKAEFFAFVGPMIETWCEAHGISKDDMVAATVTMAIIMERTL